MDILENEDVYSLDKEIMGKLFILNNLSTEQSCTKEDERNLIQVFQKMGFNIGSIGNDLNTNGMKDYMVNHFYLNSKDHKISIFT